MKKNVKIIIGCIVIGTMLLFNLTVIVDKGQANSWFSGEVESMAVSESVIGNKHQIQAGCNGESFKHFKQVCCKGSSRTCVDKCPTGVIYSGCSTHGRLPL